MPPAEGVQDYRQLLKLWRRPPLTQYSYRAGRTEKQRRPTAFHTFEADLSSKTF